MIGWKNENEERRIPTWTDKAPPKLTTFRSPSVLVGAVFLYIHGFSQVTMCTRKNGHKKEGDSRDNARRPKS